MLASVTLRAVVPSRAAARRGALRVRAAAEPEAASPPPAAAATAVPPPADAPPARPVKKLVETPVRARSRGAALRIAPPRAAAAPALCEPRTRFPRLAALTASRAPRRW